MRSTPPGSWQARRLGSGQALRFHSGQAYHLDTRAQHDRSVRIDPLLHSVRLYGSAVSRPSVGVMKKAPPADRDFDPPFSLRVGK